MELEKLAQKPLENLVENSHQKPQFIELEKLEVGARLAWRSTDRSTANCQISDHWGSGRPAGRPRPWNREQISLPVDRPGRPGLSKEQKLSAVDRVGRPAFQHCLACTSVHVGRPAEARQVIIGIKMLVILA